ncbi:glycosyltransferase family 2 protein [Rhodococcus hoagii]|nr:glycosyltransferase family 2 protein [Prescottella equi]
MRTSVVTVVSGRHDHLRTQLRRLRGSTVAAHDHVVVAMGDRAVTDIVAEHSDATRSVWIPASTDELPLARARNLGAEAAIDRGADLLVFLDVDCVPHPRMLGRYERGAATAQHRDTVLCGPRDLSRCRGVDPNPGVSRGGRTTGSPASGTPGAPDGTVLVDDRYELFWSLSFAVRPRVWQRLGGFCEDYTGYGGEDTDFAQVAAAAGVGLAWVGGADAYHLHHRVSDPPVEHLDDILRNAAIFERRWGWWPMRGWLDAFESRGLIRFDEQSKAWSRPNAAPVGPVLPALHE